MIEKRRAFTLIGACFLAIALGLIYSAIYNALPVIGKELHATISQLQWIVNIYGIFICCTLVTCGRLADIYGRKRIYLIGSVIFLISMIGSGLSTNINCIIFFQC